MTISDDKFEDNNENDPPHSSDRAVEKTDADHRTVVFSDPI
jgi:hypothetical protein